jgi:hypothetical protein
VYEIIQESYIGHIQHAFGSEVIGSNGSTRAGLRQEFRLQVLEAVLA